MYVYKRPRPYRRGKPQVSPTTETSPYIYFPELVHFHQS